MTFEQFFTKYLTDRGLFDDDAQAVIEVCKTEIPSMSERWGDDMSDYHPWLLVVLIENVKHITRDWLKENRPKNIFVSEFE